MIRSVFKYHTINIYLPSFWGVCLYNFSAFQNINKDRLNRLNMLIITDYKTNSIPNSPLNLKYVIWRENLLILITYIVSQLNLYHGNIPLLMFFQTSIHPTLRCILFQNFLLHDLTLLSRVSLVTQMVKNLPPVWKNWIQSLGREDPLEKDMATHSRVLAWRTHWQRSLVSYSPWTHKESDMTKQRTLSLFFIYSSVYMSVPISQVIPSSLYPW